MPSRSLAIRPPRSSTRAGSPQLREALPRWSPPACATTEIISARLGTVALASGNGFSLDLYGDSLIKLQPGDAISAQVRDVMTGQPLSSLVQNTGKLRANGGSVQLTAVAARQVLDSVINSSGVVQANSVGAHAGKVVFGAATAATKPAGAPTQTVKVSGTVSAAGYKPGIQGGLIQITGEDIQLAHANINASGQAGGGKLLIGGDFGGGSADAPAVTHYGQTLEATPIPNATTLSIDAASVLNASALSNGDGGKVVLWSNSGTTFLGTVKATGGPNGGNGGFVEISSPVSLVANGTTDVNAPRGATGQTLFDPNDVFVVVSLPACVAADTCGSDSYVTAASLVGGGGVFGNNVEVDAGIVASGNLNLDANATLFVLAPVSVSGTAATGTGTLTLSGFGIVQSAQVASATSINIDSGSTFTPGALVSSPAVNISAHTLSMIHRSCLFSTLQASRFRQTRSR